MSITPQHQKGEPDEKDLEHAYNRARSIGLFLVEKYAREAMKADTHLAEFVMAEGKWGFQNSYGVWVHPVDRNKTWKPIYNLLMKWPGLNLLRETMRFTADGPVRREW